MPDEPDLSIVLLQSHSYARIRKTLLCWAGQTLGDRIEAVIVRPVSVEGADQETNREAGQAIDPADLEAFHSFQIVEVQSLKSVAEGFVPACRVARAEIVMLAEDHAFPDPDLAEHLLNAYESDPDIVAAAAVLSNANPRSTLSWATLIAAFSHAVFPRQSGVMDQGPGHNTSYRKDFLLGYGEELLGMIASERMLHFDIQAGGKKLFLITDTRMHHVNVSRLTPALSAGFWGGRLFGGSRRTGWSLPKRILYALAFPLVPIIRIRRILQEMKEAPEERAALIPGVLPALTVVLVLHALGEACGYLFGVGNAYARYAPIELFRRDQLNVADLAAVDGPDLRF